MCWFQVIWILLGAASGFSQTFLELSANVSGAVCPGVDVVYNCTTDDTIVNWIAKPYFSQFFLLQNSVVRGDKNGSITITRISGNPFTSTLTITYSEDLDSTEVICGAGNGFVMNITYKRLLATAPVVSDVDITDAYEENTLRLTLQFTVPNRRGIPTLEVLPSAVSLGSLQNITSYTFIAAITLHYNNNYTLTITARNCIGQRRQHINILRVNCSIPNVTDGVRVWPFTDTTGGAIITYSCSDGYWPQTNQTSLCTQVGSDGVWMPQPALNCSIVCSAPPSLVAVPVQASESRTYVEGDVVNFQCLSGLSPADVMTATCTMEGSWRPDPQLLHCFSTTEDLIIITANNTTQGNLIASVAGMCFFLLGLLCGVAAGVGAVSIYIKCNRKTHPPPSQRPSPAPLYDDIELPTTTTKHDVVVQHNVAYGHVN